jgi:probable blue pigment (indigoidine) exporter
VSGPPEPPASRWSDLGWLVVLGILWGSAFPIIRAGLLAGASPLAFGAARFAIAGVAMGVIAVASRDHLPDRRTLLLSGLYGGIFVIAGYAAFLYTGEEYITGGLASIFVATAPLWTVVISRPLIGSERIETAGILGLLAGFAGVVVLVVPEAISGERNSELGGVLAVAAVVVFVIGSVMLKRSVTTATGPWGLTVQFACASAFLAALAISPVAGPPVLPVNMAVVATLVWLALVPSVVGYTIYFRLHHRVGPTRANLVTYIGPVVGVAVGIGVFAEAVTAYEGVGFLLVIVGLVLLHRGRGPPNVPVEEASGRRPEPSEPTGPPGR